MSGIGTTIETDLVGELVEVRFDGRDGWEIRGRGRVRAVHVAHVHLVLWLEVTSADDQRAWKRHPEEQVAIGELVRYQVTDEHSLRLIKEPR